MNERIKQIMDTIEESDLSGDEKRDLKASVVKGLNCFVDYYNQVVRMEIFAVSVAMWNSTDSFIYSQMDKERRFRHNLCIKACDDLNKLCRYFEIPDIFTGSIEDRHDVATFCGAIVADLFQHGIKK